MKKFFIAFASLAVIASCLIFYVFDSSRTADNSSSQSSVAQTSSEQPSQTVQTEQGNAPQTEQRNSQGEQPKQAELTSVTQAQGEAPTEEQKTFRELLTSNNPDFYARILLDGDKITVNGKFTGCRLTRIRVSNSDDTADFVQEDDGSFTAELNSRGENKQDARYLSFSFENIKSFSYRIRYENGWVFDRNGLEITNRECFEHIIEAPQEAVRLYISAADSDEEIQETLDELLRISNAACDGLETDYEKAQALCLWVSEHISYDFDARETDVSTDTIAIHSVLNRRRTVCAGFANTLAALLQSQGIRAVNIKGSCDAGEVTYETLATGVENHEWVAIELDGRWFFADATWNTENTFSGGEFSYGKQNLRYFDPTDECFAFDHRADRAQERDYFALKQ